jgi:hypothetical protein
MQVAKRGELVRRPVRLRTPAISGRNPAWKHLRRQDCCGEHHRQAGRDSGGRGGPDPGARRRLEVFRRRIARRRAQPHRSRSAATVWQATAESAFLVGYPLEVTTSVGFFTRCTRVMPQEKAAPTEPPHQVPGDAISFVFAVREALPLSRASIAPRGDGHAPRLRSEVEVQSIRERP